MLKCTNSYEYVSLFVVVYMFGQGRTGDIIAGVGAEVLGIVLSLWAPQSYKGSGQWSYGQ